MLVPTRYHACASHVGPSVRQVSSAPSDSFRPHSTAPSGASEASPPLAASKRGIDQMA